MEKAIIIFCLVLGLACSETKKEELTENNEPIVEHETLPVGFCSEIANTDRDLELSITEVQWMYLDDSLKNICRPLNFQLPWMESDIKTIPEKITLEILGLSPIRTFEIIGKEKGFVDDNLFYFYFALEKDYCHCEVYRFYKGIASDKKFTGYEITEQIICNAKSGISGLSPSASLDEEAIEK
jgi:hypothetical protein